ncbi:MAG: SDR family oxidoreductase [Deltaproteobacteria bacterium]|nr:SDR family oxidoreductase [Deltaproteobacteria bacterium]
MVDNVSGKVVVITGASSGIGEAAARHLAARGASLALGARRQPQLEALARDIREAGGRAQAFVTDVTRRRDVEALVQGALRAFGRVDVLVNNAGIMPLSPFERLKVDDWDRMIDVNIKGLLYGVAAVLPIMKRQESGHIINVSSVAGHKVRPGNAVYAATKHAVRAISEGLRQELKPHVRTTIISPGAVATELAESVTEPDLRERTRAFYAIAIPADAVARAIAFAIAEPAEVDVNEILLRPTLQEF